MEQNPIVDLISPASAAAMMISTSAFELHNLLKLTP
jgi:hypothetical protein